MATSNRKQAELRRLMKLHFEKKQKEELFREKEAAAISSAEPKSILKSSATTKALQQPAAALTSLLQYEDSSNEEDNGTRRSVSWPTDESKLETTHVIEASTKTKKRARFVPPSVPIETSRVETNAANEPKSSKVPSNNEVTTAEDDAIDPGAWKEFEALLEDEAVNDDTPAATTTGKDDPNQSTETEAIESPEEDDAQGRVDTSEIEQASYEARIAQLRLKAAARRKRKQSSSIEATTSRSSVDTYTPELAELTETKQESTLILDILRGKRQRADKDNS